MRMMKAEDATGPSHRELWSLQTLPERRPAQQRASPRVRALLQQGEPGPRHGLPVSHLCPSSTRTLRRPHPLLLFFCSHPVVFAEIQGLCFRCAVRMMPCDLPKDTIHTGVEVRVLVWRRKKVHLKDLLLFSCSAVSDSLRAHGLQHARPPCPSLSSRVYPNSCPLSRWCHPTISSSVVPFSSCPQSFPASGCFSSESALHIRWPKYWTSSYCIFCGTHVWNVYVNLQYRHWEVLRNIGLFLNKTCIGGPGPNYESYSSKKDGFNAGTLVLSSCVAHGNHDKVKTHQVSLYLPENILSSREFAAHKRKLSLTQKLAKQIVTPESKSPKS